MQYQTWEAIQVPAMQYSQGSMYPHQQSFLTSQEAVWFPSNSTFAPLQMQHRAVSPSPLRHDLGMQDNSAYSVHREGASPMRQQQGPLLTGVWSGPQAYQPQQQQHRKNSPMRPKGTQIRSRHESPMTARQPSPLHSRQVERIAPGAQSAMTERDANSAFTPAAPDSGDRLSSNFVEPNGTMDSRDLAPRLLKQQTSSSFDPQDRERFNEQRRQNYINQSLPHSEPTQQERDRLAHERRKNFIQNSSSSSPLEPAEQEPDVALQRRQQFIRNANLNITTPEMYEQDRDRWMLERKVDGRTDQGDINGERSLRGRSQGSSQTDYHPSEKSTSTELNGSYERQSQPEKTVYRQVIKEVPVEIIKEIVVVKEVVKEIPVEKIVIQDIIKEVQVIKEVIREIPVEKVIVKQVTVVKDIKGIEGIFKDMKQIMAEVFSEVNVIRDIIQKQEVRQQSPQVATVRTVRDFRNSAPQLRAVGQNEVGNTSWVQGDRVRLDRQREAPERERARPEPQSSFTSVPAEVGDPAAPPRLTGLGMRLERREGSRLIIVEEIIAGFAADLSGQVAVGDIVEKIDGHDVTGWSLDMLKRITVGPVGSKCSVRIRRDGALWDLEFTRAVPHKINEGTSQQEAHAVFANSLQER